MDKRLNLSQIAELMAGKSGMSKANAERFVKSFFDIIAENAVAGESVKIKGLGTFKTIMVEDRESIRVNTGERFVIPGYKKVNFIPDAILKEEINKPFSAFETLILSDSQAAVLEGIEDSGNRELTDDTYNKDKVEAGPEQKSVAATEYVTVPESLQDSESGNDAGQVSVQEGPKVREITQKRGVRIILKLLLWMLYLLLILLVLAILFWPLAGKKLLAQLDRNLEKTDRIQRTELVQQVSGPVTELATLQEMMETESVTQDNDMEPVTPSKEESSRLTVPESKPTQEPKPVVQEPRPIAQELKPVQEPAVSAPENHASNNLGFHLSASDERKDLGLFTAADTVNYRMTGTLAVHKVKEGETLTQISLAEYGTKKLWPYIAAYNNMKNSNSLNAGSRILIPSLESK